MCRKGKLLLTAGALLLAAGGVTAGATAFVPTPVKVAAPTRTVTAAEYQATIDAMKPPNRARPVVAVIGDNRGTEAIDFLVPYGVLKESGVAEILAVSMTDKPLKLRPALTIKADLTTDELDRLYPGGADYVVVPAMFDHDTLEVLAWVRSQAARGATIVAICSGAEILANAGLLRGRAATTHWASVRVISETEPTMRWVPHRRYVADRGVVTTTGVSAAIPASIALVEAIAGRRRAAEVAADLGVTDWGQSHDSRADLGNGFWVGIGNAAKRWKHEDLGVPVADGVDEIALALTADTWSRTYRSKALTIAGKLTVRTRHGLELIVDQRDEQGIERMLEPISSRAPATTLDRTLVQMSRLYGKGTARFVATQLEHDPPGER